MRRFYLYRKNDPSGMSGTGIVAVGVEFSNGKCAITWRKEIATVTIFDSITMVEKLHNHDGKGNTKVVFVDDMNEDLEEKAEELRKRKLAELQKEEEEKAAEAAAKEDNEEWREPKKTDKQEEEKE